jgi:predicted nucleic acid-binding protein
MQKFIQKNLWNIIIYAVGIVIAFTALNSRVIAIEKDYSSLDSRLTIVQNLTERLIVLEEKTSSTKDDISEIKDDIKALKEHFNLE